MRGIMFVEKGQTALIEEPMPVCTDDTMLLKTLYSGLSNGTERSFLMGGNYGAQRPWPKRIAYQHVSEVVECGTDITRFHVGDIVFSSTFPGHVEYHLVRETDLMLKLPDGFDLEAAALLGLASVSFHNVLRAKVRVDDRVLVIGDGLIGQFAAQASRVMGASVTVAGHHTDRLELAQALGADMIANTNTTTGQVLVESGKPYSVIFECSGGDVLNDIIGTVGQPGLVARRSRARLVMVAGRFDVTYNFNMAGNAEIDIIHTQHFDQSDLEQIMRLVLRGDIRIKPLMRDVVPIADAVRIFNKLRDHPNRLLGTVFVLAGK